ncbi:vertebrate ancient opsin-like isoform X1 [Phyllopteryx taeniolatus]|uniref:vertebrate ancient opsin-like isoform X1 n=1 Tax=Phyllopteryx taeniolatus TaxID=161469 RepID=UPI002AD3A094|nr:vertebrate ancient opsin-like isoform X1 [Phyllopteryx taeniolatus]
MLLSDSSICAQISSLNGALHAGAAGGHADPGGGTARSSLTPTGHLIVAVCLGSIGALGLLNNSLVLLLYWRYKILRSPINLLLVNICISDLLVCVLGTPFSFAASTQGRWLIGAEGCVWYGFANSLFGIVSLISLAVLSYERYSTMMTPTEADSSNYCKIGLGIALSWLYSLVWTLPPLFGWSRYGPEGPGTTCSVDWKAKTANNVSYIICLFIFCLVVPLLVIVFCYGKLLCAIRRVSGINASMSRKREQRVLFMVVIMVICYLMCWLPYGIMALLAAFGPPGLLTPEASIVPSVLAKISTVINPVIYVFMNKQFYRCFQALLHCEPPRRGSSVKSSSKVATKPARAGALTGPRRTDDFLFMVASLGQPAAGVPRLSPSLEPTLDVTKAPSSDINQPVVVSLVAHFDG